MRLFRSKFRVETTTVIVAPTRFPLCYAFVYRYIAHSNFTAHISPFHSTCISQCVNSQQLVVLTLLALWVSRRLQALSNFALLTTLQSSRMIVVSGSILGTEYREYDRSRVGSPSTNSRRDIH